MTTEDQIRDEKLQYDINREAAKISALSASKIDKYQYLTGEEILPSNQQQIIEQAKFTYSPLGKTFEKQTKAIEDQERKQIDALAELEPKEIKVRETKPNKYRNYFLDKLAEIRNSSKIGFNNLKYTFKDRNNAPIDSIGFKGPLHIFKSIHDGIIPLEDVEKDQIKLKSDLGHIRQGNPKNRSEEQNNVINNVTNLYESREKVILMFNNDAKNMSRNIYESKQGTGLKILTPKQMLQRLPIAFAQIKAGNNSESLLNEIRQIVYYLYQSKEIIKKVYNNIIKLIKV